MKIGVDYYPEHWDRELWEADVNQMKEAGVQIVRMAEFAWSRLEPSEGMYDFTWLDEAITLFASRKIQVFLCTPTATPPLWLFEKYPEVIQVDKSGHRIPIGIRGHRCVNNALYRQKCEQIISHMVSRYRDNEWVIGYQIDNELEANHCCCPTCENKFREFVQKKYGTVDAVNKAYGNNVWSGEYSAFSQVKPPCGEHQTWLNPSYMLDFNRYASASTVEYVEFQRKLIHSLDENALITTNNWLCENMPDFYDMFEHLDFVSYDNYPATVLPEDEEELYSHGFHLDLMRGIKKKNFWIMEQLSGGLGSWTPMIATLQPGMLKGYALQAIAHGADAVLHFRWRTAVSGAEMFWHGIIDHSNVPGRRYQEFCDLCKTVHQCREIQGSVIQNKVAVLYSSEQEYGFKIQPQVEGMHYFTQLKAYHDAFTCLGMGVDIVDWKSDLEEYDIVVAPTLYVTKAKVTESLKQFVKAGGQLILSNRSGVKDEYNKCIMEPLPTVFSELTGATVREYNPIGMKKQRIDVVDEEWKKDCSQEMFCSLWCDILRVGTAKVLANYNDNFYRGEPAITSNQYGEGMVYYVGTVLNRQGMISFAKMVVNQTDLSYIDDLPLGIEVTTRVSEDKTWTFVFNNTSEQKQILKACAKKLGADSDGFYLAPFEMRILSQEKEHYRE